MNRIFVDLDGVVVDFLHGYCKLAGVSDKDPDVRSMLKNYESLRDIPRQWANEKLVDQRILDAKAKFWENLKPLPWCDYLFKELERTGKEVYILTSVGKFKDGASAKLHWVQQHMPQFNSKHIIITKEKYLLATSESILIDDLSKNTGPFEEHKGYIWHWPNQYKLLDGDINIITEIEKLCQYIKEN